jgi:RNA polymerase-binding transcription factor DksA
MDNDEARARLLRERERLLAVEAGIEVEDPLSEPLGEAVSELSSADQHPADEGSETASREVDLSLREHLEAELAEIDAALARIEAGTYGICEACGKPIEEARLEAIPYARFCLRDQEIFELEHRGVPPL